MLLNFTITFTILAYINDKNCKTTYSLHYRTHGVYVHSFERYIVDKFQNISRFQIHILFRFL